MTNYHKFYFLIIAVSFSFLFSSPAKAQTDTRLVGNKSLAVILFNFSDVPWPKNYTDIAKDVQQKTFTDSDSLTAYYRESSFGKLQISGKVFGPYPLTQSKPETFCDNITFQVQLGTVLIEMAKGTDKNIGNYDYYLFYTPAGCPTFEGLTIPPFFSRSLHPMAFVTNGDEPAQHYNQFIATHELGHLFGLGHSNGEICYLSGAVKYREATDFNGVSCYSEEYGDPFSVMGETMNDRQINNYHKLKLGWIDSSSVKTIEVGQSGVYELMAANNPLTVTGQSVLRIPITNSSYNAGNISDAQLYYYLEYRAPIGQFDNFSATDSVANGVLIRLAGDYDSNDRNSQTFLLNTNPMTPHSPSEGFVANAPIRVGQTFTDNKRGLEIKILETNQQTGRARVKVAFNSEEKPTISITSPSPANNQSVVVTGSFPLSATFGAPPGRLIKKVELYIDNSSRPDYTTSTSTPSGSLTRHLPAILPTQVFTIGAHKIEFIVTDDNNQSVSAIRSIAITANTVLPPPSVFPQSDITPPTVEIVSVTPGEALLDANKHIMGYLPTKIKARAKDSSGISKFNICVGNGMNSCVSICGKTTGIGYVSCNSSFNPIDFANQTLRIVAVAYDGAPKPNRGEDSVQFPISVIANTDSSCIGCSGIVVFKPDTSGSKTIVPPPVSNGDTTPPTLRLTPAPGPTSSNKATTITLFANDPSGLAYLTIMVKAPQVTEPLLKTCDLTVAHSQSGVCALTVPANQWVIGATILVSAIDYSSNRNPAFDAYKLAPAGQLRGR